MDNNLNNPNNSPQSQTWTDPITGEIYPSGNPHADINSSRVVGASQSYSAPPPQSAPQAAPYQQAPQMQQMPQVEVMPAQPMPQAMPMQQAQPIYANDATKFCEQCGSVLVRQAVICPTCGCQVAPLRQMPVQQIQITQGQQYQPMQVIVNNGVPQQGTPKDKTTALLLCIFLGYMGVHRFYEGRIGTGILWLFTWGLFGLGWFCDIIRIACATNPYYVK